MEPTVTALHARLKSLVPDFEFCCLLKRLGFPQNTIFGYEPGYITGINGKTSYVTYSGGASQVCAAPTADEMQLVAPNQFYIIRLGLGFSMIDMHGTKVQKHAATDKTPEALSLIHKKIIEADAVTPANCWAKGLIYLATKHGLKFENPVSRDFQNGKTT